MIPVRGYMSNSDNEDLLSIGAYEYLLTHSGLVNFGNLGDRLLNHLEIQTGHSHFNNH